MVVMVWTAVSKVNQFGERATSLTTKSPERGSVTRSSFARQNVRKME
jgi:hypothetical protein